MAERPELLGLATNIVSAHVSHNAVALDHLSGLIQQVFNAGYRRTGSYCATKDRTRCGGEAFGISRSYGLPGLRQKSHHAEAPSDDGSQTDAGAVPAALGATILIPLGRSELCENEIGPGKEIRAGSQGISRAEEDGTESCSEDGGASVIGYHRQPILLVALP